MITNRAVWPTVTLGEICRFKCGKSLPRDGRHGGAVPVYGSNGIVGQHCKALTHGRAIVIGRKGAAGEVHFARSDCWPIDTTYYIDRDSTRADLRWLFHRLQALRLQTLKKGATVRGLNLEDVCRVQLKLPPPAEQKRTASMVDACIILQEKRRSALAHVDHFLESVFCQLIGNPNTNPRRWSVIELVDLLTRPLRNGLSPSTDGTIASKVLTLSAVAHSAFDEHAWKLGTFRTRPPADCSVDGEDFLICRGHGNLRTVGRGLFPTRSMPDTTFPDTIIAARLKTQRILRGYFQFLWNGSFVRRQLEPHALTKNGTFKVNQEVLGKVKVVIPDLKSQREFQRITEQAQTLRLKQLMAASALNELCDRASNDLFEGRLQS